jgi:hypothetical protein
MQDIHRNPTEISRDFIFHRKSIETGKKKSSVAKGTLNSSISLIGGIF